MPSIQHLTRGALGAVTTLLGGALRLATAPARSLLGGAGGADTPAAGRASAPSPRAVAAAEPPPIDLAAARRRRQPAPLGSSRERA